MKNEETTRESFGYAGLLTKYQKEFFEILFSAEQYNPDGYKEFSDKKTTVFKRKKYEPDSDVGGIFLPTS